MDEEQEERSFTVSDKRFSARRDSAPERSAEPPKAPSPSASPGSVQGPQGRQDRPESEVTFASLLILLGNQAIMHLGGMPNPMTQQRETDIPAAKQMIDLLGVLEAKTTGNLTGDEEQLLRQLLLELRLQFVRATGR